MSPLSFTFPGSHVIRHIKSFCSVVTPGHITLSPTYDPLFQVSTLSPTYRSCDFGYQFSNLKEDLDDPSVTSQNSLPLYVRLKQNICSRIDKVPFT